MAIGLPVIATDFYSGAAKELVSNKNVILVPVNDSGSLSRVTEELPSDSDIRHNMSNENIKLRKKYLSAFIICIFIF